MDKNPKTQLMEQALEQVGEKLLANKPAATKTTNQVVNNYGTVNQFEAGSIPSGTILNFGPSIPLKK
ncbi:hypothetical protein [Agarivorans sp. QJM3NY_25]|uniref:hypothetical protein n=1 Tax=Agarivorans sp. QJM3NY_25 TaxID=3421430 RepID=UPI003D7EB840